MAISNTNTHRTKIAIDTIFFNMPYSGISRVWETILTHLEYQSLSVEIILLIRGKNIPPNMSRSSFHKKFPISQIIHINEFAYPIMQQDVDYLNQLASQHQWTYFISTYFTYCTVIPNILLIHDMIPEICDLAPNHMWIQKDLAIRNASYFICISETTKHDLLRIYPYLEIETYPITVIHNSITTNPKLADTLEASQFYQNIISIHKIQTKHYILTMATNQESYKNQILIKKLIDKYLFQLTQKLESAVPLIVITKNISNSTSTGILTNGILLLSDVSEPELQILYKNAAMFINPSLAEGFGLPVFEAFMHKIPVIACNLPVYEELCPGAITYIENDVDDLFQKITNVLKNNANIQRRIDIGNTILAKYNIEKQISRYKDLFNSLTENHNSTKLAIYRENNSFLNIIFQSYNETNSSRKSELEYCILANLAHPEIKFIHDFAIKPYEYLPSSITSHPKYINVPAMESNNGEWLTYKNAFIYSSNSNNAKKFGIYWAIINCDIMLAPISSIKWHSIRGWLNSGYILAQSRHEYDPISDTAKMDSNFSKLMHANTQDAWFYSNEKVNIIRDIKDCNFNIGMLGCDNAIAQRLLSSGYKVINMPITYPIWHYDIVRGKNSLNFIDKHRQFCANNVNSENGKCNISKPKNTHPERSGQSLIPNYDTMLALGGSSNIDLITLINQMGGISNWEKYKLISEMMSSRILIYNP